MRLSISICGMISVVCILLCTIPVKAQGSCITKIGDYESVMLSKPELALSDKELEETIYDETLPYATEKTSDDRIIEKNDVAEITYSIRKDGEIYNDLEGINEYVCVGAGTFDQAVEESLIGQQKGALLEIPVRDCSFVDDYDENSQLKYEVHIDNVYYYELPELSDIFIKNKFNMDSQDEFDNYIREKAYSRRKSLIEDELKDQLLQIIVKDTVFDDCIDDKITERYNCIMDDYESFATLYHTDVDSIMETYKVSYSEILDTAEKQEKAYEVCQYIFAAENMCVTPARKEELNRHIMDKYCYEDIEEYIASVGNESYEEEILIDYVLDVIYGQAIFRGKKYGREQQNIYYAS